MADGIKKISENVIRPGRALTLTNTSIADYDGIPSGSLRTVMDTKGLQYKISNNNWSKFMGEGILEYGSITTNLLANKSVTNPKIADQAVDTRTLKDSSVTTIKIADLNVTTQKIANLAVTTSKLDNKSVTEPKLGDSAVSERTIAMNAVTTNKIKDRSIIEIKIAQNAVTNYQIARDAVQTPNILDLNVTYEKIADGAVYGAKIPDSGIDHMHIRANAVTTVKVADGAITGGAATSGTGKIAAQTITSYNIKDKSLSTINFADKSVTGDKIAEATIENKHIANNTISKSKLDTAVQSTIDNAVVHDSNGHAKVIKSLSIGTNPQAGYALAVDGDMIANRVYNAVYMDIAEGYVPGEDLEPGDIVAIESDGKVYKADMFSKCIVGVVSDQYATCFGATPEELRNKTKVAIGLIGKVPVKVKGYACIGQYINLSDEPGVAVASTDKRRVVGKVIENKIDGLTYIKNPNLENEVTEVLCLIFPS